MENGIRTFDLESQSFIYDDLKINYDPYKNGTLSLQSIKNWFKILVTSDAIQIPIYSD